MSGAIYRRREPEKTILHRLIRGHLRSFLAMAETRSPEGNGLPKYVRNAFFRFLGCGVLANGFVRVRCPGCGHDSVVGFS